MADVEEFRDRCPVVIAAAIKAPDGATFALPAPARHGDVIRAYVRSRPEHDEHPHEQGFMLSDGTFATRERAALAAYRCGQTEYNHKILISEAVW